jgi:hypothetical protein
MANNSSIPWSDEGSEGIWMWPEGPYFIILVVAVYVFHTKSDFSH